MRIDRKFSEQRATCYRLVKAMGAISFYPILKKNAPIGYLILPNGNVAPIEMKMRSFPSTQFDSTLIEQGIVDRLKRHSQRTSFHTILYAERFTDEVVILYHINEAALEWCTEEAEISTVERKGKKNKTVTFLPYSTGTMIDISDKAMNRPYEERVQEGADRRKPIQLF